MATPGQLVDCVATALKVPHATVVLYDRVLAENGLRSKGGRGKSAAKVTAEDAANLLIAIAGSASRINSAVATVEQFASLTYQRPTSLMDLVTKDTPRELAKRAKAEDKNRLDFMKVPGMEDLRSDHSFREGITALIEAVRQRKITFKKRDDHDRTYAYITLQGPSFVRSGISLGLSDLPMVLARYEPSGKSAEYSDLNWTQTISHRTILAVARLLALQDAQSAKLRDRAA